MTEVPCVQKQGIFARPSRAPQRCAALAQPEPHAADPAIVVTGQVPLDEDRAR
jgi:hypothetical protein